jgi:hypothetical protein
LNRVSWIFHVAGKHFDAIRDKSIENSLAAAFSGWGCVRVWKCVWC